jgi:uncharacterized protein YndB with AHSA1/START domain
MTTHDGFKPPICQLAFSVVDLRDTERWFREGLGFLPAGGNITLMSGPIAARVQGLPGVASCAWWLVGRNPWFQIEMFQFRRPMAKLMPADFRPCDVGYTRFGVHVHDFDAALERLGGLGTRPIAPPVGERGRRRACVRNPDGVYVEVMEDDPLPEAAAGERGGCPTALRYVTMSTPDFEASVAYLTAINGHGPEAIGLHGPEHEALWGLAGADCRRAVFRSGDVLLEVVQYIDSPGRPWPDGYRICDQGILNVAYGARSRADHDQVYARASAFGARPNTRPMHLRNAGVVYLNDRLAFSVEVLWMRPGEADRKFGFEPLPADRRPEPDDRQIEGRVHIAAPVERVWQALNDQDRMGEWIGFKPVTVIREGQRDRNGVGSERRMKGPGGTVVEQVTAVDPMRRIRYRVIEGAPFIFHRGEVHVRALEAGTEVVWRIGFRRRLPFTGGLLRRLLQPKLQQMLDQGLKPFVERGA